MAAHKDPRPPLATGVPAHLEPWGESGEATLPRCRRCKQIHVPPRPDPCLGVLEGVSAAECGHGRDDHAYAVLVDEDGIAMETLYAEAALAFFRSRGVGPFGDVAERARNTTWKGPAARGLVSRKVEIRSPLLAVSSERSYRPGVRSPFLPVEPRRADMALRVPRTRPFPAVSSSGRWAGGKAS